MLRLAAILSLSLCLAPPLAAQDDPPSRVAALSWGLAESLVALGVDPAAVADVEGYRTWVGAPALPEGTRDVGLRTEPNLEALAEAAPDLILVSDQQADMEPALRGIAEVWHIEGFDAGQDNAEAARAALRDLGARLGRGAQARDVLAEVDARVAAAGARVRDHFDGAPPPVLPIRLLTPTTVRVHSANGMALAALEGMGLSHPDPGTPTEWGFVQRPVEDLAAFEEAAVVNFVPFPARDALFDTQLWSFMPFVRGGRFAEAGPVWTFGGPVSIATLAEAMADALLTLDPEVAR
ncbi:ABC transporter substrate-binding protein [Roseivivax marinus]|uniref:ABC transporter substrate-binding protein n=1 Tax=Roseivivax marinus TaxID=1379903 RepID=UPI00273D475B|nr:ABC transporter substrate-binding protein [Roseivivax marinus]